MKQQTVYIPESEKEKPHYDVGLFFYNGDWHFEKFLREETGFFLSPSELEEVIKAAFRAGQDLQYYLDNDLPIKEPDADTYAQSVLNQYK